MIQVFALCRRLANQQGGCARIFLVFYVFALWTLSARAENSMLWTNDELFFDEELLEDIAKKLMRSYDVRIEIADSLKNRRFYGSFKVMGNTIEEVLETIASTNRMKYRYENEKYILY